MVATPVRYLDTQGFAWTVAEVRPADLPSTLGALYFFSGGSTLRLKHYPEDWAELSRAELDHLRHRAEVMSLDLTRRPGHLSRQVVVRAEA